MDPHYRPTSFSCQAQQSSSLHSLTQSLNAGHCSSNHTFGAPRIQHHSADSTQDIQARPKWYHETTLQQADCTSDIGWVSSSIYSYDIWRQHDDLHMCCREEGVRAFWRGNGTNVVRIFPYSAVQFSTNDFLKRLFTSQVKPLPSNYSALCM